MKNLKERVSNKLSQGWDRKKIEEFYGIVLSPSYSNIQKVENGNIGHNKPDRYDLFSRTCKVFYGSIPNILLNKK